MIRFAFQQNIVPASLEKKMPNHRNPGLNLGELEIWFRDWRIAISDGNIASIILATTHLVTSIHSDIVNISYCKKKTKKGGSRPR